MTFNLYFVGNKLYSFTSVRRTWLEVRWKLNQNVVSIVSIMVNLVSFNPATPHTGCIIIVVKEHHSYKMM